MDCCRNNGDQSFTKFGEKGGRLLANQRAISAGGDTAAPYRKLRAQ